MLQLDASKIKTGWDLTPLLASEDARLIKSKIADATIVCQNFSKKYSESPDLLDNPTLLKQFLDDLEVLETQTGTSNFVSIYFGLKSSLDEADPKIKAWLTKIEDATRDSALIFQRLLNRITKTPVEKQNKLLESAELIEYRRFLIELFEAGKHTLSDEAEKVLLLNSNTSYGNWVRMTSEFLTSETVDGKTFNELFTQIKSPDKKTRDGAAASINTILTKYEKVAEAELNSVLEYKKVNDILRNYPKPDSDFSLSNNISEQTIQALIDETVSAYGLVHKYYEFRAELLGLEKLNYHERSVEYGSLSRETKFEEASQLVFNSLQKLDPDFAEIFLEHLYKGQIDVFPKKGKSDGAYAAHTGKNKPNYVLLNFDNRLSEVFTLAHEMGHSINHELLNRHQKTLYAGQGECVAEIASIFFESFAIDEVAQSLDDESRLSLLVRRLDEVVSTVFRQIACYRFERDLHADYREKGFLTSKEIGELFVKNMSEYCGPFVVMNEGSQNWWIYWSHIRSFFYVYSYAFGYLVAKNLQKMVKEDPEKIYGVKKLFSAGSSKLPEEILGELGVNINDRGFWKTGISETGELLNNAIALAKKLGKIK